MSKSSKPSISKKAKSRKSPPKQPLVLNLEELIAEFRAAAVAMGVDIDGEIIADGKRRRYRGPDNRRPVLWVKLHASGLGYFGSYRTGYTGTWRSAIKVKLNSEDKAKLEAQIVAEKNQLLEQQRIAAKKAQRLWERAQASDAPHAYLIDKCLRQSFPARRWNGLLVILISDRKTGDTISLQFISKEGEKRFVAGSRTAGGYCVIPAREMNGVGPTDIIITESFSTGQTLNEATGFRTEIAFSAQNLLAVAEAARREFPNARIIIAADDDARTRDNPGLRYGRQAAIRVNGTPISPAFPEGAPSDATDFNDLISKCGMTIDEVRIQINVALDTGVPPNFKLTRDNLFLLHETWEDGRMVMEEIPVSSRIEVTALTRSSDNESWGRLLKFPDADDRVHEWAMPMEMLAGEGTEYRARLLDQGLTIHPEQTARYGLFEYLMNCKPRVRCKAVRRLGWHGAFVLPDATFGAAADNERVIYQSMVREKHAFNVSGILEDWQREIATPCVGNSRLTFAVSAAFVAPLLYLVGAESGGFHLIGPSSLGKTTAARVAGSVWGGSDAPSCYLRQWRATANGLEGVAALHCDALLALDEIAEVGPKEAAQVAYMLANGSGKSRGRPDGSARTPHEWRVLFLSTGEITLADKVREDSRQRATAGQSVRILDIPADTGKFGLFEDLHGTVNLDGAPSGQVFANQLRDASQKFYGTAIRIFLTEVAMRQGEVADVIRTSQKEFLQKCVPKGAHPQVQRAAERFALVAAAGELATALGITGWDEGAASSAAERCFADYVKMRGHVGAAEVEAGIEQVRRFFQLHGGSRFATNQTGGGIVIATSESGTLDRVVLNRAGYRQKDGAYAVFKEVFKNEVCAGYDVRALADALAERGLLRRDKKGNRTYPVKDAGKATRMYVIEPSILGESSDGY